jgi:preprotein translocase subunit SecD
MKYIYIILLLALTVFLFSCVKKNDTINITSIKLELKLVADATDEHNLILDKKRLLDNSDIANAFVTIGQDKILRIIITLKQTSAIKFKHITEKYINRQIAILLDEKITSAPFVRRPITGGSFEFALPPGTTKERALEIVQGILNYKSRHSQ